MTFLIKDEKLLEKYNEIWKKSATLSIKNLTVYNEKWNNRKINTDFHNNETPKEGSQCICLSVIFIDSVYRKDKDYFPQVFLECKYVVKEKKTSKFITDDINISSDDCDGKNFDEEN